MAFERRYDKDLYMLAAHAQSHKLKQKCFACPGRAEDGEVGVMVYAAVEKVLDSLISEGLGSSVEELIKQSLKRL